MMSENNYCVIMAGGAGSRFWPLSTNACPKQFLDPLGFGKSFIRCTFERFLPIIPRENFLVVTSAMYRDKVLEHLPELHESQVLTEPVRRNTAPCIAYATQRVAKINPKANIIVAPSDHVITNEAEFINIISDGLEFVNNSDNLLTIGIKPSRAETGYGYIQFDNEKTKTDIYKVKTFTEKPDREMAEVFVRSGEFLWNSGIFIWSVRGITDAFRKFLPEIFQQFQSGLQYFGTAAERDFIDNLYAHCQNISIDYGILEKSPDVYVRAGNFGWSDLGTWGAVFNEVQRDANENMISGKVVAYDTRNTIINIPEGKVAVVQGLDGYIVAQNGQNLLICKLNNEQTISRWVEDVKFQFGTDYI